MLAINQPTIADADDAVLRPTHLTIDLAILAANYKAIAAHVGRPVMLILKANAYGHGMIPVAQQMEAIGTPWFGVAYLEEGIMLRQAGITAPILVLGGIAGNQIRHFIAHDLTLTASSIEKLNQIEDTAGAMGKQAHVHLKIDTGMERIGVHYYSARSLLAHSLTCQHTIIDGIYSHFANADAADLTHARLQLARFNDVLAFYDEVGAVRPTVHMANSGAILQLPEAWFDMVRPGLLAYGVYPDGVPQTIPVHPALSWQSQVVYFKVVRPHHPVSYGSAWQADEMTRIVTIPVGYGDGYSRRMSGMAEVLIRGKRYPVVGRICMDQMMVNIGWDTAYNGDPVTLLGCDGDEAITVSQLADWSDTITWELLTSINTRVPRIYVNEIEH